MANIVFLTGRLTKDPEMRMAGDTTVANFTLAVDRPVRAEQEKKTDFIRIVVFGRQAENCERYLAKGRLVGVQGSIQTGSYKNKEGQTVYTTDVIASRVEFLEYGNKNQSLKEQQDSGVPEGFHAVQDDELPF